ncbi:hypothetical protein X474_03140 [Dethiosulfatarculus sandiegensis]|uniref:Aldehyde ferredoxin oxidoreductase C-terminal domain-containing protein n=1 Tax=Dethiosulfatarculus sandiegensis TaxID=1429043 RepID=A0A0D2GM24_9BACT|nr:hypothetical protein X474_03140 [Dethiosulfatarculus sandiegensis]
MAAERGYHLQRAVNTLRGLDRRQDSFTRRPEPDSWAKGIDLNKKGMLDEYYAYRGLTEEGLPTRERLEVAVRLESMGRLGYAKNHLPLEEIIKDPSPNKFGRGLKNKVRTRIMGNMSQAPENLKQQFLKAGEKQRLSQAEKQRGHNL